jgi:hypothetical protein
LTSGIFFPDLSLSPSSNLHSHNPNPPQPPTQPTPNPTYPNPTTHHSAACGEQAKSPTVNKANAQNAILFEAISLCLALDTGRDLLAASVDSLGRFLSVKVRFWACCGVCVVCAVVYVRMCWYRFDLHASSCLIVTSHPPLHRSLPTHPQEPNIRYLALETLTRLALIPDVNEAILSHQATVTANLKVGCAAVGFVYGWRRRCDRLWVGYGLVGSRAAVVAAVHTEGLDEQLQQQGQQTRRLLARSTHSPHTPSPHTHPTHTHTQTQTNTSYPQNRTPTSPSAAAPSTCCSR